VGLTAFAFEMSVFASTMIVAFSFGRYWSWVL
jgi:hypothetical protein